MTAALTILLCAAVWGCVIHFVWTGRKERAKQQRLQDVARESFDYLRSGVKRFSVVYTVDGHEFEMASFSQLKYAVDEARALSVRVKNDVNVIDRETGVVWRYQP